MSSTQSYHEERAHPAPRSDKGHERSEYEIKATNLTPEERKFLEQHVGELSKSTLRAKWINKLGEKEDRPGQTLATQNHEVIQHWAEERGGVPATIQSNNPQDPRVLRFNFPGYGGQNLREITWDEWFKPFDARHLVFLFQQRKGDGSPSNFFHLDSPEREHD